MQHTDYSRCCSTDNSLLHGGIDVHLVCCCCFILPLLLNCFHHLLVFSTLAWEMVAETLLQFCVHTDKEPCWIYLSPRFATEMAANGTLRGRIGGGGLPNQY